MSIRRYGMAAHENSDLSTGLGCPMGEFRDMQCLAWGG